MTSDQPQRVVSTTKAKRDGETPIASPSILHFQKPICQATASTQQGQLTGDSFFKHIPKPSQSAPSVPRPPHTQPPAAAAVEVHPSLSSRPLTLNSAQPASPRRQRSPSFLPSSSPAQQSLPASSFCPSASSFTSSRPSIFTSSPQIQHQQPVSLSRTQQQPPSTSRSSPQTQHQQPASLSPCQPQSPPSSTSLSMALHHQPQFRPHQPSNTCTTPVTRKSVLELGGLIPMTAKLDFWALKSPEFARDIWLPLSDGGSGGSQDEEQEEEAKLEENRLRILGQMGLVPLVSGKGLGVGR